MNRLKIILIFFAIVFSGLQLSHSDVVPRDSLIGQWDVFDDVLTFQEDGMITTDYETDGKGGWSIRYIDNNTFLTLLAVEEIETIYFLVLQIELDQNNDISGKIISMYEYEDGEFETGYDIENVVIRRVQ